MLISTSAEDFLTEVKLFYSKVTFHSIASKDNG